MVDFDRYRYFPSLRTRLWELRGYRELKAHDKDGLLPTFVISKLAQRSMAAQVCESLIETIQGRRAILDLETSPIYACDDMKALTNPDGGFAYWRQFVKAHRFAVPTALLPAGAPIRDVVRQVIEMERTHGKVVIRSRSPMADLPIMTTVLSSAEAVDNLLFILDFGYVRSRINSVAVEAADVINSLRNVDGSTRIVVMGSSYPRSAAAYDDSGAHLAIEERQLHTLVGGDAVTIYGDHASIHPEPFEAMQTRFVPRIDYALPDEWIFRRAREDRGGFIECARRITALEDWDEELVELNWGAGKIADAAAGKLDRMGTPGAWIAVRVNMHLWQQLNYGQPADDEQDDGIFG